MIWATRRLVRGSLPGMWGRALVTVVSLLVLAGCGGEDGDAKESGQQPAVAGTTGPDTFDVAGVLRLTDYEGIAAAANAKGSACFGDDGYDDISGGTIVIVRDMAGDRVGVGELVQGYLTASRRSLRAACEFFFEVLSVPDEGNVFTVEVGERGEVRFDRDDAEYVELTLG